MAESVTIKATCLCGAAAHELVLPHSALPLGTSFCNCDSCRHMTGTLSLSCTSLPPTYQPSQELLDKLEGFQFSKRITQYHCKTCGALTIAHNKDAEKGDYWDIASGTLEKFDGVCSLKAHIFVRDTKDGGFADFLPTWEGKPVSQWSEFNDQSEELPRDWRETKPIDVEHGAKNRLHAYCKCKGVQFWIARPSKESAKAAGAQHTNRVASDSGATESSTEPWWLKASGTKYLANVEACNSCRLASGMEFVEWMFVPKAEISLDPEGKVPFEPNFGSLKAFNSSPGVTRYFCSTCGALVFYWADDRPEVIDIGVGLLNAPEGARAETWLEWRTERVGWREDAVGRADSLLSAVEYGLKHYAK